jgi:hypothetical protein
LRITGTTNTKEAEKICLFFLFFCVLGGETESRLCYAEHTGIGRRRPEG